MGAVHHDVGGDAGLFQCFFGQGHGYGIIVRLAAATAQYHMSVLVALGGGQCHTAFRINTQEAVWGLHTQHGVDGHIQAAIGAILEAHRAGQTGRHFPVGLAFGGTGANRVPGDQILNVLGGGWVQCFGGGRQAQLGHVQQQFAGDMQTILHLEGIIHVGVVDQPLPASCSTWLLEIDPQHQVDGVFHFLGKCFQLLCVVHGRLGVMDRAGADDHEQTVVLAVEDVANGLAPFNHRLARVVRERQLFFQRIRGDQEFL